MTLQVETIGDAYMVASGESVLSFSKDLGCYPTMMIGIPVRNGVAHVREIARMSLRLMETVKVMMVMVMVHMNLYLIFMSVFECVFASLFACQGQVESGEVGCIENRLQGCSGSPHEYKATSTSVTVQ